MVPLRLRWADAGAQGEVVLSTVHRRNEEERKEMIAETSSTELQGSCVSAYHIWTGKVQSGAASLAVSLPMRALFWHVASLVCAFPKGRRSTEWSVQSLVIPPAARVF